MPLEPEKPKMKLISPMEMLDMIDNLTLDPEIEEMLYEQFPAPEVIVEQK